MSMKLFRISSTMIRFYRYILFYRLLNVSYMKNCEPFVPGPRLAIDKRNGLSCFMVKFSSKFKVMKDF